MSSPALTSQPLRAEGAFNWVYLIEFVTNGILCLFFLFYFNRVLGTAIAYAIRLYTWHKFKVYVDIEALQLSPLAGRIFFKNVRYHGDNVTVLIHGGYVTWRYWLGNTKRCKLFQSPTDNDDPEALSGNTGEKEKSSSDSSDNEPVGRQGLDNDKPCRILLKVYGVEGFLYNRSPAYDWLTEGVLNVDPKNEDATRERKFAERNEKVGPHDLRRRRTAGAQQTGSPDVSKETGRSYPLKQSATWNSEGTSPSIKADKPAPYVTPPAILRLLPIRVECNTAGLVLGNENTPSVITAKCDSAKGEFDASSSGPFDIFKILMNFDIVHPYVQMKPNVDYKRLQLEEAEALKNISNTRNMFEAGTDLKEDTARPSFLSRIFHPRIFQGISIHAMKSWESIAVRPARTSWKEKLATSGSRIPGQGRWFGLRRYLQDDQHDEHDEWEPVEYASSSLLADVNGVDFKFYWDIAGRVPSPGASSPSIDGAYDDGINSGSPPEYGMEIRVRGGTVNYGPWADRHRIHLQNLFFPMSHADANPTTVIPTGEYRLYSTFSLKLSVDEDTILRIPFRESSKDWKWKGRSSTVSTSTKSTGTKGKTHRRHRKRSIRQRGKEKGTPGADVRPFAWFDVKVRPNTTVNYVMDMLPRKYGYNVKLQAEVSALEIYSSLNHGLLWQSGGVTMQCDLSTPLAWNGLREWSFDLTVRNLDLFILRDHTFLLMDLISDWSTGPLHEFFNFVPYRYLLNIAFENFKLFLNTNDANIVNSPDDFDDNNFLILYGRQLAADLVVPIDRFRPSTNEISFNVKSYDLGFELRLPPKNTVDSLLRNKDVAQLRSVQLLGSYTNRDEVRPGLTETLFFDITGEGLRADFYGFFARHLVKIRENYFGEDVHFRTLEEYQFLVRNNYEGLDSNAISVRANDLDVILDIKAINSELRLPAGIYDADEHVLVKLDRADVDLRVGNYYLELMVNSSPLEFSHTESRLDGKLFELQGSQTQLSMDGLRFFGHRLFGLPPSEPPYVSNWDIDAGIITGECSSGFVAKLVGVAQNLALTMNDPENAVPTFHLPPLFDSTFVRFQCELVKIWCDVGQEALLVSTKGISGTFNDFGNDLFSQRLHMSVADITCACCDASSTNRVTKSRQRLAETHAYLNAAVNFDMVQRNHKFTESKWKQQDHIYKNDITTRRAGFLIHSDTLRRHRASAEKPDLEPTSIPLPSLPSPLASIDHNINPYNDDSLLNKTSGLNGVTAEPKSALPSFIRPTEKELSDSSGVVSGSSDDIRGGFTTVAFSSPFKLPRFHLDDVQLDLTDVPSLPKAENQAKSDGPARNIEGIEHDLDEDAAHVSFMVDAGPGIVAYCKPRAIYCVATLIDRILPKFPENVIDNYFFSTMSKVQAYDAAQTRHAAVTEVSFQIPFMHVRFVNEFQIGRTDERRGADRYDLVTKKSEIVGRSKSPAGGEEGGSQALHGKVGSISVSAQEGLVGQDTEDVAFRLQVDDIFLWLAKTDRISIHASFRSLETAVESKKLEYLAALIHRTVMMAEELQLRFKNIFATDAARLRFIVYQLATNGIVGDPLFLTRPAYALQSTQNHIRNRNSWKIISKLRYIYQQLPQEEKARIITASSRNHLACPNNAEREVLNAFEEWRSWDAIHAEDTFAVRALYGSTTVQEQKLDAYETPLELAIRAGSLKVIVDPTHDQSDFTIDELGLSLSLTPPTTARAIQLFQGQDEPKSTVIQINTTRLALNLNWGINELIDQLLTRFEQSSPEFKVVDYTMAQEQVPARSRIQVFHIVLCSDTSLIQLETVNLRQKLTSEGLRASVTGRGWTPEEDYLAVNAIISTESSSAELFSQFRQLGSTSVSHSSLWVAYAGTKSPVHGEPPELKIAGDCQGMLFETREEILGLIEIANSVLFDEAMTIRHLAQKHSPPKSPNQHENRQVTATRIKPRTEVALFLKAYDVRLAITTDLSYRTAGEVIRSSITPDPTMEGGVQVNFDLKAQTHDLSCNLPGMPTDLAPLRMPPLNGTVRVQQHSEETEVSATVTMEFIRLEGAAIYSILSIIGTPSVISALQAIQDDGNALTNHIKNSFPELNAPKQEADTIMPVIFNSNVVLAGCSVSADAPARTTESIPSRLTLKLGSTQLRVGNRGQRDRKALPFPEMRIDLEEVGVDLYQYREGELYPCGGLSIRVLFTCAVEPMLNAQTRRRFKLSIVGPRVDVFAETAPTAVQVIAHLQDRVAGLDLSKQKKYLRRVQTFKGIQTPQPFESQELAADGDQQLAPFITSLALDVRSIQIVYAIRNSVVDPVAKSPEDLVLSLKNINLITRSENEAQLKIEEILLQVTSPRQKIHGRALNSAVMPEVIFNVAHRSTEVDRKLVFHATGKALDIQLEPHFMLPVHDLERSITSSSQNLRLAASHLRSVPTSSGLQRTKLLGDRRISSLTVDADFAGAIVSLQARKREETPKSTTVAPNIDHVPQHGRYGQFSKEGDATGATLRSPGIAVKAQYSDTGDQDPSLSIETKVSGSSNELQPGVVPLIMQISDSVKQVVRNKDEKPVSTSESHHPSALIDDKTLAQADPRAILGKTRFNLGFRICKQEVSLSCRPIAKVGAKAQVEDIYITVNSVDSNENGNFFAATAVFAGMKANLQHVYSREPTFSFDIDSIVLSLMNSRHLSGMSGLSAILRINPTTTKINAKQLQDVLLFREIWLPAEIRNASKATPAPNDSEPHEYFVQRYHQVAAQTAFPWNASVAVASLNIDLDLGQAIGKLSFRINDLWASSKKSTSSQQTLCIGVEDLGINSTGRMSGFLELERVKIRTSIAWPQDSEQTSRTPLIQASLGFDQLRIKASFDYQVFAVAHITSFEFIMYNARDGPADRLVAILDGDKVNVYCIASTAALTISLIQAFERLIQETEASYDQALQDIEKFLRRRSVIYPSGRGSKPLIEFYRTPTDTSKLPLTLHTDVVVTLKSIDLGCFPSTLFDHQILRMEASDIQARFAVQPQNNKIHSGLGLNLGQVRVALAAVPHMSMPKTLGEISIEEVVRNATTARGGVILRVPKVVSSMQTWQAQKANLIDYVFRSTFEGKIDVGWNYSRISFIRGMWATHSRTLAARLGKPLPESAVKIHGGPQPPPDGEKTGEEKELPDREDQKITAEVSLPQSKYTYRALEPPIIETPQLRELGEATPPLEWVGLNRDKLPNVTHQIIIVALQEVAKEVEDAYSRILGSA